MSRHRGHRKFTLPLAIVAGFVSPVGRSFSAFQNFGLTGANGALSQFTRVMLGFDPYGNPIKFESWQLRYGLLPVLLGILVHKVANWTGVNRALAQAGIPVIRI